MSLFTLLTIYFNPIFNWLNTFSNETSNELAVVLIMCVHVFIVSIMCVHVFVVSIMCVHVFIMYVDMLLLLAQTRNFVSSLRLLAKRVCWPLSLADLGGAAGAPPPPNRINFFRFCIHFYQKVYASEVGAPERVGAPPPPNGKSWIRHCLCVWCCYFAKFR